MSIFLFIRKDFVYGEMEEKMINLYSHGGSKNHGCEAIVRSTCKIIPETSNLFSYAKQEDCQYKIDEIIKIIQVDETPALKPSLNYYLSALEIKMMNKTRLETFFRFKDFISNVKKGEIYLSIGGDNYCYPGVEKLSNLNYWIHRKGARTVLWGCSVEPSLLKNKELVQDLASYDLITARESISYNALRKINTNTVLVSDPAFTLDRIDLPLPYGWKDGNMVGINISPLILDSASNKELAFKAYCRLIETILNNTDCGIALIPHVVWDNNDDRQPLFELFTKYKNSNRILLLDDYNCMELKGYIARCRFFIGARTHATIAAYSNFVPTLVLGYSVKSRGIACDLFGTDEFYVLPVQSINKEDELARHFIWLMKNEDKIKNTLKRIIPNYIDRAYEAKKALEMLL